MPFYPPFTFPDRNASLRPTEDSEQARVERTSALNAHSLTRDQERHLCADYTNQPGTNGIDNRRDYAGPRWPWLCGPPEGSNAGPAAADQDPLHPNPVRRVDGAVPAVPIALRPGHLDVGDGAGQPAPEDP